VSELEEIFAFQIRASKIPAPLRQYPGRETPPGS
jgi:hypothetical protein